MAIRGGAGDSGFGPSISASAYVPRIFAKKMEKELYASTVYQDICSTQYEGQINKIGDEVMIRQVPEIAIGDYQIGDTISYTTPTKASVSLKITEGKTWSFKIDDIDAVQVDVPLLSEWASDASERMKIRIDVDVLSYMSDFTVVGRVDSANFGATAGAVSASINMGVAALDGATAVGITGGSTGNAVDYIVYANQVLDEQNVPSEGRWIVLPSWYIARMKTGDLRRADVTGDASGVIRNGQIGMVDRMTCYQNNNLASTLETAVTCFSIPFGVKDATSFATQIVESETVRLIDQFGDAMRGLCVYGRENVHPERLGVLYAKTA